MDAQMKKVKKTLRGRIRKWTRIFYLTTAGLFASIAGIGVSVLMTPTGASPQDLLGKIPFIGFVVFLVAMVVVGLVVRRCWDRLLGFVP